MSISEFFSGIEQSENTYPKCKVTIFIKHFLILPILYEGSTLMNLGFLVKENFCKNFTRLQNFSST